MSLLKELIQEIEDHTGKKFDLSKKRHFFHLNGKIERLHKDELRKLHLIEKVMKSESGENDLYNDAIQFTQNRFRN